ncbi:unnamed protein product [Prorocentrum cordatum]|uniref:Uncharacterized protein n=1 Tax=Prorocentrum cordatum TaxID=2364126 RepID=A0ABN9UE90_9DINO|nr:unnamed protein product [Polarella glacialis]
MPIVLPPLQERAALIMLPPCLTAAPQQTVRWHGGIVTPAGAGLGGGASEDGWTVRCGPPGLGQQRVHTLPGYLRNGEFVEYRRVFVEHSVAARAVLVRGLKGWPLMCEVVEADDGSRSLPPSRPGRATA